MLEHNEKKLESLLMDAMKQIDADTFRAVIAEQVRNAINNYDVKHIIDIAAESVARTLIKDIITEPEVIEAMRAKVRNALMSANVAVGERRY